jgi:NTE family protein
VSHEHTDPRHVDLDGAPAVVRLPEHPLTMVYGGGGAFGIAYGLGVAHGLASAGIPVAGAPALGTSAGSWVAAMVALGLDDRILGDVRVPRVPDPRSGRLWNVARCVFGDARHPLVSASAVCVRTRRRHILDGGRYALADLAAASSAVPGLFAPHRIDGRLYVDGGMWSATSIDAAAAARWVIVVAPLAGRVVGPIGRGAGLLLGRELRSWRERHPWHRIDLVRPDDAIARLAGRNPLGLFDGERARLVYPLAYEQGCRVGARLLDPPASFPLSA